VYSFCDLSKCILLIMLVILCSEWEHNTIMLVILCSEWEHNTIMLVILCYVPIQNGSDSYSAGPSTRGAAVNFHTNL